MTFSMRLMSVRRASSRYVFNDLARGDGVLGPVLEQMEVELCLFFAKPKINQAAVNSSSVVVIDHNVSV